MKRWDVRSSWTFLKPGTPHFLEALEADGNPLFYVYAFDGCALGTSAHQSTKRSRASGSPSASIYTVPSGSFRTKPVMPSSFACSIASARKKTPWTLPAIRIAKWLATPVLYPGKWPPATDELLQRALLARIPGLSRSQDRSSRCVFLLWIYGLFFDAIDKGGIRTVALVVVVAIIVPLFIEAAGELIERLSRTDANPQIL